MAPPPVTDTHFTTRLLLSSAQDLSLLEKMDDDALEFAPLDPWKALEPARHCPTCRCHTTAGQTFSTPSPVLGQSTVAMPSGGPKSGTKQEKTDEHSRLQQRNKMCNVIVGNWADIRERHVPRKPRGKPRTGNEDVFNVIFLQIKLVKCFLGNDRLWEDSRGVVEEQFRDWEELTRELLSWEKLMKVRRISILEKKMKEYYDSLDKQMLIQYGDE
ncbi:hypothetical protein K461DRAFT_268338 [Myriangium duriaei CBS 260.36]|uniref:Uncharacterized protein n=1 Tax=Myriangium duriaei CBS 260.36 TaxID=1168546 RepID=A0A9P4J347_9PEZI|nr:hypothetical protein K461DRAFT_268338 [Myriangium duriaei CBS 260.36]